jgi:hypothetical protein
LAKFDLKTYARQGAEARLRELNQELAEIYRAFPELRMPSRGRAARPGRNIGAALTDMGRVTNPASARGASSGGRAGRKPMTAAQRAAVSERMRKYWAARKTAAKRR